MIDKERGEMKRLLRSVAHIYETDKIGTYNNIKRVDYKTLYLPDGDDSTLAEDSDEG